MRQLKTFGDTRTLAFCAFCGGETTTTDHCPSKVLLDEPYPDNLPVVFACEQCNGGFSLDEEYLACVLDCVVAGSTNPPDVERAKVRRILEAKPALKARIESARIQNDAGVVFSVEDSRVRNVVIKLAQGHSLFELHELCLEAPSSILVKPLILMSEDERKQFETPTPALLLSEVGSRAMQRVIESGGFSWLTVQEGRYRYLAEAGASISIRIVIGEYLACQVWW